MIAMVRLGVGAAVLAAATLVVAAACLPSPAAAGVAGGLDELSSIMLSSSSSTRAPCDGAVGECGVDVDEELGTGAGAGEALRRSLARQPTSRYISYVALRADQVPCNRRGRSYYSNCASQHQANPYQRGCSAITQCERNMN